MKAHVFDNRQCFLGEGPLWHPVRHQLFWFDIINAKLLSQVDGTPLEWQFDELHSAAGWVDDQTLMIVSETGFWTFDIPTGRRTAICALEADNPLTRSNDGRADPMGGFWVGTMGKSAEKGAGAIYRYYRGEVRKLFTNITIPNAICFAPDGGHAYFSDTVTGQIMHQGLDPHGWPKGDPEVFVDLRADRLNPDGAVVDAEGALWNAQWGAGRVARYLTDGSFDHAIQVGGRHSSCPAFGGTDFKTLFITTACEGIENPDTDQGRVYAAPSQVAGLPEYRVIL